MTNTQSLTERVLDQIIESNQDHQPALIAFSTRLENSASDLINAWSQAFHQWIAPRLNGHAALNESKQSVLAQTFFGQLKSGNLRRAMQAMAQWNRELADAGLPFDLAHRLIREQQRATVTLAVPAFRDDPQLPVVLDALDDWFDGVVTAASAAFVEAKPATATTPAPTRQLDAGDIDAAQLRTLGQLTDGMTHALNDLFTILLGQTQLLSERVIDPNVRAEVQEIQNTAGIGARVVRRIQDYVGAKDEVKQAIDVNALLRDASEITRFLWRDRAEATGKIIDVVKDFADVPPVFAKPGQLRQVLVELIMNAIDALPNGGVITLLTERKNNSVFVSIIDNGIGMSDETRARATEAFFTTKASPHLGIGLHHAAQVIAEHFGTLTMNSAPDKGTTIVLALPVSHQTEKREKKIMPAQRPARILVIDNEPAVRALLARLLTIQGHSAVSAESGMEGISAFKREKFDAVFTDLGMPEMSGWEVATEIKKLNAKTMVVLTTGWPLDLSDEELKAKHVDQVVTKPFDLPKLYALVDEAVAENDGK